MHAHLQQRMDSIAMMKCIGARSSQMIRIYLLQTMVLGLAGGLLGVVFGIVVQRAFPALLARYFQMEPTAQWDFVTAAQGIAIAMLATLLFTLPPLLGIRRIRPSLILRREMEETKPDWRTQARPSARVNLGRRDHPRWIRGHRDVVRHWHSSRHLANRCVFCRRTCHQLGGVIRGGLADVAGTQDSKPRQAACFHPARHRESISSGHSRAVGTRRTWHRRDVHTDRLLGPTRHDRRDESHRAAGHAQRVPDRHRAQGSRCGSRFDQAAARH